MTELQKPERATITQLTPTGELIKQTAFTVQFNPETLKVSYANQIVSQQTQSSEQEGSSSSQATGGAKTTLAVELWFDATAPLPAGLTFYTEGSETAVPRDVRRLTKRVSDLLRVPEGEETPRVVQFAWGTFLFSGLVESVEEAIEFFSPKGVPLRASVSFSILQQSLEMTFGDISNDGVPGASTTPAGAQTGQEPTAVSQEGDTMPDIARREGVPSKDVKQVARQNNIPSLRRVPAGQRLYTAVQKGRQAARTAERTSQDWRSFAEENELPTPPEFPSLPPNLPPNLP